MGLDVVEVIMAFEEEFGISIPDADCENLTTPRQVTEYVWGRISHERVTKEQVAARVREVVIRQTANEDFNDDSHFMNDMGLD